MNTLLIKNKDNVIFESKSLSSSQKLKKKNLNNIFVSDLFKKHIGKDIKLSNFIKKHFDLSKSTNYFTSSSNEYNLEKFDISEDLIETSIINKIIIARKIVLIDLSNKKESELLVK